MLKVTIKDNATNEVLYDDEVRALVFTAREPDGIRFIQRLGAGEDKTDLARVIASERKRVRESEKKILKIRLARA